MKKNTNSNGVENWHFMVDAAKRGLEQQGYQLERQPGRGLSNVWNALRDGSVKTVSIRTTRNRWIAFPPLEGGDKWKTLDDVDLVAVSAVDSKDAPKNIEVYVFEASEVKSRFNAAYQARRNAGQVVRDDFGMWICLDTDNRNMPVSVGSGLAEKYPAIVAFSIDSLAQGNGTSVKTKRPPLQENSQATPSGDTNFGTISEVMEWARARVAEIAVVSIDAVKLDLKIEY